MRPPLEAWPVRRARAGVLGAAEEDRLAAEEPLEIRLNGRSVVVTMRTPGADEELALGFLVNEGVLRPGARAEVSLVRDPAAESFDNVADVRVAPEDVLRAPAERAAYSTSACGVCGQASLQDLRRRFPRVESPLVVRGSDLAGMAERMRAAQRVFDETGGLHATAAFAPDGTLLALREDVGRHNAFDKTSGWALRAGRFPLADVVLLVSGRAGYEVVQKAVASGVSVVAAVGAPSSLAALLAERSGVTLVGFLRGESFNAYTHSGRILA